MHDPGAVARQPEETSLPGQKSVRHGLRPRICPRRRGRRPMSLRTRLALSEPHPQMGPLISSYQDGLTSPQEADLVERHLLECERCRDFYGGLQQARDLIADLPAPAPDPARLAATYNAVLRGTVYKGRGGKRQR